jgi:polar amino acid transport system substrate-binding protein
VLPQAFRIAVPPTVNEFISLLKLTSLASVISLTELMTVTQTAVARTFHFSEYYTVALLYYLVMVFALVAVQRRVEQRFAWADRSKAAGKALTESPMEAIDVRR